MQTLWRVTTKVALLACMLSALNFGEHAYAQSDGWSAPVPLSGETATGAFPDVVADTLGGIRAAWSSTDEDFDVVMSVNRLPGGDWSAPVDIVALRHNPNEGYVTRPAFALDPQAGLRMGVHGPGDLGYVATVDDPANDDPHAWQLGLPLSQGYHIVPQAAGDTLHVVYTQGMPSGGCQYCLHLFHIDSSDGGATWSDPVDISRRLDRGAAKPQLLVGQGGSLHVVWESGVDGDRGYVIGPVRSMYAASYDGGVTWTTPFQLDSIPASQMSERVFARNVTIAQAGDGTLVAAWWNMPEDQVMYRTSTDDGRTWSNARSVPRVWGVGELSTTRQDTYSMVTDSSGAIHLLMVGRLGSDDARPRVLQVTYQDGGWLAPRTIAAYDQDLPEWPQAVVALGNQLFVVWHVRPQYLTGEPTDAPMKVWESQTELASPALAPVAPLQITNAATTTTAVIATPQPTPTPQTPFERAAPASSVSMRTLMSENDDVLLLTLSLLPAVLLIVVGLLWLRRRS